VVAEEALLGGAAAHLANALREQPAWSDLPLIVLLAQRRPGSADPALSSGLGVEGLAVLLERPLRKSSLISTVRMLLRARRRQYEVRDHLNAQLRATAELERAGRAKDEFLAMLAHELRNPLGPIRNASVILERLGKSNPGIQRVSEMIARQSGHMTHLLDGLLDVSRITRGKITLERTVLNASTLARDALEIARPLMEFYRHNVRVHLEFKHLWVRGDATRLAQVLGNLLINAAKYTPPQGEISFTLEETANEVIYRVRDNGIGIDAQLLPTIFELFSQAETGLDRSAGGLGIGLAVVKGIVEMHDGSVAAVSKGLGEGAEFIIRLPRVQPLEGTEHGSERKSLSRVPQRVLVVDDNSDLADTVAVLLRDDGHEVRVANDGLSALKIAEDFKPNAAVLDIGLPGLNGYELARQLRSHRNAGELLLIATTGYGQPEDRERAQAAGFDCHLVKPLDPHALSTMLAEWANRIVSVMSP
jgi:signal transduction histidine kinase/CheY-like chemotaxis protein